MAAALTVALALAVAGSVPVLGRLRRSRRRRRATAAADRVLVAWDEAAEALARRGLPRLPAETLDEHASRAADGVPLPGPAAAALQALAGDAAAASYGAGPVTGATVGRAVAAADTVEDAVRESASAAHRLLWAVDPRLVLGYSRRRKR